MVPSNPGDYAVLRHVPIDELDGWISRAYPAGKPVQWWISVLESVEIDAVLPVHRGDRPSVEPFNFAASLLRVAAEGQIGQCQAAYWSLRFAALAVRCGIPADQLPEIFTPNGSVRSALSAIPITKQDAIAISRRRNVDLSEGSDRPADRELRALQDTESLILTMKWICGRVSDSDLVVEVSEWLDVYGEMAPTADPSDM